MSQLAVIVCGMSSPCTVMIPVTLWDFKFPAQHFYQDTLPDVWMDCLSSTVDAAEAGVRAFFNLIAIAFSTMANDSILETQAKQVADRVPRNFEKSKTVLARGSTKSLSQVRTERSHRDPGARLSPSSAASMSSLKTWQEDVLGVGTDGVDVVVSTI
eukprot:4252006-Amphidinium_carterae.1